MKKLFFILLVLEISTSVLFAEKYNIASYNVRNANESDSIAGNAWSKRMPYMAKLIKFHDFDLFGTQEGKLRQLQDLMTALPEYEYIGVGRDNGKQAGEHSAIFYKKDKFKVLDHGDFWLSETPEKPSKGWGARYNRICSWGKFKDIKHKKTFLVFNLHLDHQSNKARSEGVKLVLKKIQEQPRHIPVVLIGDFNVDQNSEPYKVLNNSGILKDTYDKAEFKYVMNETFDSQRIDHIFVTDDFKVKKYGVLTDCYQDYSKPAKKFTRFYFGMDIMQYEGRKPSDHFPVLTVLEL